MNNILWHDYIEIRLAVDLSQKAAKPQRIQNQELILSPVSHNITSLSVANPSASVTITAASYYTVGTANSANTNTYKCYISTLVQSAGPVIVLSLASGVWNEKWQVDTTLDATFTGAISVGVWSSPTLWAVICKFESTGHAYISRTLSIIGDIPPSTGNISTTSGIISGGSISTAGHISGGPVATTHGNITKTTTTGNTASTSRNI